MKFSDSWLREWVNPALSSDELAEQITMAGLEVDEVVPVAGQFSGVVIGQVMECGPHPNAEKLQVTKVDVGGDELLDIVCGAPNCRQGLKVVVATVGAVLPGGFKIKKAKLRGEPSFGMLCSEQELELSDAHEGIIELPEDAPIGLDVREYLDLDDVTIDVDLTANRGDCLSIRGLAREVGVLNRMNVTGPAMEAVEPSIDDTFEVTLSAPQACPRYLGRVIRNVNVNASAPRWMQEKLRRCGIRSIDPVVDVTNYVLLELGQPMHAFDLNTLKKAIDVRLARGGETLTLLDGNQATLNDDTLVIADERGPIAMAGIFGGLDTGVTTDTRDVFLECAYFAPLAIMGRARSYGLHTDSSHRFERGIDPELQYQAMERATQLLVEICGGDVGPVVVAEAESHLPAPCQIFLRRAKLDRVIGIEISDDDVMAILTRLGLSVEQTDAGWLATAPGYRGDLTIEEDLIEEVARVYGYNNIPDVAPTAKLVMPRHSEAELSENAFRQRLISLGYQEAITYSFVDPNKMKLLFPESEALLLPHPISVEMSAMRVSLWPGLLDAVVYNQNRQQSRVRLFETGLRFVKDPAAENGVRQDGMIAGVLTGSRLPEQWSVSGESVDFFDAKGDVQALLALTAEPECFEFRAEPLAALHPGQSAAIYRDDQRVGWVGALHPQLQRELDLNGRTMLFELELAGISRQALPEATDISRFPANRRDIAVVVEETVVAANVVDLIRKVGGNQLVGVNLFDVYRGKGVAEGCKSLAISLILQDNERTLEEKEIAQTIANVVEVLKSELNASLRD